MSIITLTSDFGLTDAYVGILKGVMLRIAPAAQFVDLSHDVAPQNVRQAAYVLSRAAPYFPPGTVHLVVVDPGVGSKRRALLVGNQQGWFVGPDNGALSHALLQPGSQAYVLDRPEYWLSEVSPTFHGRDIFAPVAAHLAQGVAADAMGSRIYDAVSLPISQPARRADGSITGQVVYIDRFGNLITDVPADWLAGARWRCEIAGLRIPQLSTTYADVERGALLALVSSGQTLEIAVREGSAAQALGVCPPAAISVYPAS